MADELRNTRDRILNAAYQLFYRHGFTRVSVDAIAERTGVTKRTLYYHFESKDDIIASVLEVQHNHLLTQYQSWLGPSSDTARDIVINLFSNLKIWADGSDWLGSGFTRISAELADMRGHPARQAASRHKEAVETWLAGKLAETGKCEAEMLAREIMLLIEGSMSLALIHGNTEYFDSAFDAAKKLIDSL